jgi:hypothetical protein
MKRGDRALLVSAAQPRWRRRYGWWLLIVCCLPCLVLAGAVLAGGRAAEPSLRIVAFGDNEGVIARPGDDPARTNPLLPRLMDILREEDQRTPIDLMLHTGDFVRFDPSPQPFMHMLGPFLGRFYPTSGGDEEFLQGKYWAFVRQVPHLYQAVLQRVARDGNGFEPYYAVHHGGVHLLSLHNPENYGESERTPEFAGYDLFRPDHVQRQQYRWLVERLEDIRQRRGERTPIIVLSHRPVYNQSRSLVELFDRYQVDLVLSGNMHVYARAQSRYTQYLVTGIMGDQLVGGCERLNNPLAAEYLADYRPCYPGLPAVRREHFAYHYDHYVEINIRGRALAVKAVEVADRQVLDQFTHSPGD